MCCIQLSLRVVLLLPEGIKVNAGMCVSEREGECTLFWLLNQASKTFIQNQNKSIEN